MALPSRGLRAGKIAGIEVQLDWSLIVIFWLILVNLATDLIYRLVDPRVRVR